MTPPEENGDGAPAAKSPGPDVPTTDWAAGTQRVRDTSTWIITAFVALSTVLIGSGPLLAHLDKLHADSQGVVAVLAALAALTAAGVVIWQASDVNLTQTTDVADLLDRADPDVAALMPRIELGEARKLYLDDQDLSALLDRRRKEVLTLQEQTVALVLTPTDDTAARTEIQGYIDLSKANITSYDEMLGRLVDRANFERVKGRFERARPRMFKAAAVVALGVVVWIGAVGLDSGSGDDSSGGSATNAATTSAGTIGTLTWATAGADKDAATNLRQQLTAGDVNMADASCDKVGVVSESGAGSESDPWQVAVLPRDPCAAHVSFAVDRRLATFEPFAAGSQTQASVTVNKKDVDGYDIALLLLIGLVAGAVAGLGLTWARAGRGAQAT